MAALVTGVGYIGSALIPLLLGRGERVVGLENFYCTPRGTVALLTEEWGGSGAQAARAGASAATGEFSLVEGDVADAGVVAEAFAKVGEENGSTLTVYHLAAQPSAGAAVREPEYTERTNLVGARVLLEAARAREAQRVVFGGSFRVYGDQLRGDVEEDADYGRVGDLSHLSKMYVEQLARMMGVPFVSVRLGVTYGVAPILKDSAAFMTVPNLFCQKAARGEELNVLEDRPMGFIHVQDAAQALLAAADIKLTGQWRAVNAAPEVLRISEVARLVQRLGKERGLPVTVRGADDGSQTACFRVQSTLDGEGFVRRHKMEDSLGDVLDYFLASGRPR